MRFVTHIAILIELGVLATVDLESFHACRSLRADEPKLVQRAIWTTSNFRGRPEPPLPFRAERIYPKLSFKQPTVLSSAPGTDRFFVAENDGKIYSIPGEPSSSRADLFLDAALLARRLKEQQQKPIELEAVYGLTFDPGFAENRFCYLCYVVKDRDLGKSQMPDGTRVSRLRASRTDPPQCDVESEELIITWLQGGHNGGCLKFGPDGCLYISTGDGGFAFPPDGLNSGQDVTNVLSAILRIDVRDSRPGRPYAIPDDNPFVKLDKARGEIWAYGLRNPWKMSFDRQTGELWVGDVGWELWELVYRVNKGDNFGWSLVEGRQPVHVERQRGPTPIVPPTIEIPHTEGASVTGGFVYRGQKFPELQGTYLFGDWETRRIWGAKVDGDRVAERREIVEPTVRIVDFAEDHAGELYLLDYDDGTIHALVRNEVRPTEHRFPRTLSESGLYQSVAEHRVAEGVLTFSINCEQWSDHAMAQRFLGVPGTGSIGVRPRPKAVPGSMFSRTMDFPADSVLVKTLSLDLVHGDPGSRRRIETQVLHFDGREWRGYTYEWNDEQTDAVLVEATGKQRTLQIADPQALGGKRTQTWSYASRMECIRCHNPWSEYALAFNIPQLNRPHSDEPGSENQIELLRQQGVFSDAVDPVSDGKPSKPQPSKAVSDLPRLANPANRSAALNDRARSYLHVHCAHCHRFNGGGASYVNLNYDLPLKDLGAFKRPSQGTFGIHDAQIIAPGEPSRSVLLFRLAKAGPGHMPHLGSKTVDERGLALIQEFVRQLPRELSGSSSAERDSDSAELLADRGADLSSQRIEKSLSTPSRALELALAIWQGKLNTQARQVAVDTAMQHSDQAIRDLFEPFVPEEQRSKRLGELVQPEEILNLAGDGQRGRQLFHESTVVQCRNCHRILGMGIDLGPDLSQIGKKYDRAKLLETILQPSLNIEPQFITWLAETKSGQVVSGLLVKKDEHEILLKDAQNKQHVLAASDIEGIYPQRKSLMPDLLLRDFTPQQVADLLTYLASLK